MVVLVFHLMITPVTPNLPPEGPRNTHLCVTHLLTLVAIWHGERAGRFGAVRALRQIIGLIVPATCQLRISQHLTWSLARCAEEGQRCFYAPLKRSHPWEEHGSDLADGNISDIFCYKCVSGLSWETGKVQRCLWEVVFCATTLPTGQEETFFTIGTSNLFIFLSSALELVTARSRSVHKTWRVLEQTSSAFTGRAGCSFVHWISLVEVWGFLVRYGSDPSLRHGGLLCTAAK